MPENASIGWVCGLLTYSGTSLVVVEFISTLDSGRDKLCRYRKYLNCSSEARLNGEISAYSNSYAADARWRPIRSWMKVMMKRIANST